MRAGSRLLRCAAALLAAAACTDPRARPLPPTVDVSFAAGTVVTSPDTLIGSLYAHDDDGLAEVRVALATGDSSLRSDSSVELRDEFTVDRSLIFLIPPGVPVGTAVRVIARAEDFAGFVAADTVVFLVQDTVAAASRARSPARHKPL